MADSGNMVGEATARAAYGRLADDPAAVLIDVRTAAEWTFVGVPDLSDLGKEPVLLEWQSFPGMAINTAFREALDAALREREAGRDAPLFFLCRSGARSLSAARVMAEAGYAACVNVSDGFEGPPDQQRHRGTVAGWQAEGLPWRQA